MAKIIRKMYNFLKFKNNSWLFFCFLMKGAIRYSSSI